MPARAELYAQSSASSKAAAKAKAAVYDAIYLVLKGDNYCAYEPERLGLFGAAVAEAVAKAFAYARADAFAETKTYGEGRDLTAQAWQTCSACRTISCMHPAGWAL